MQRGDIVRPIVLAGIVLVFVGKVRKVVALFAVGFVFIISISPILDFLRHPAFGAKDLSNINLAVEKQGKKLGELFILERILEEPARKSGLAVTAAVLSKHADREGYAGFDPYYWIPLDPIPRVLWPNKPIALSLDGTKEGQAMSIAGRELGLYAVLWTSGGASMYWQFWWPGVILGGLLVGFFWAYLFSSTFRLGSFFLLVILLANVKWGRPLIDGMDAFLLNMVNGLKFTGLFWFLSLILSSAFRIGRNRGVNPVVLKKFNE
jgi:hypothetical protein